MDHQCFHPRRRAAFEAMKHHLSPTRRADTEDCFDRVAALNPPGSIVRLLSTAVQNSHQLQSRSIRI
jgi:hypothetical protein